jgi:ComF family protein
MIDWFFTKQCAACKTPCDEPFCAKCMLSVEANTIVPIAPIEIVAPWRFGGPLAQAVRRLKFSGATHVARTLAPLWSPVLAAIVDEHDAIVVPIPLHWRRRAWRGYDQAWLLAKYACEHAELEPPLAALSRRRFTPAQSNLAKRDRAENLLDTFLVTRDLTDRSVVLVDDVVTTGATLSAASHAVKAAGAKTVIGLALARTE